MPRFHLENVDNDLDTSLGCYNVQRVHSDRHSGETLPVINLEVGISLSWELHVQYFILSLLLFLALLAECRSSPDKDRPRALVVNRATTVTWLNP